MKSLVLLALIALPFFAQAKNETISSKTAVIKLCPRIRPQGCEDKIKIGRKLLPFDLDCSKQVETDLNNLMGAYRFQNIPQTPKLEVEGYITTVVGRRPNPTLKIEVFHITDITNIHNRPLPK